VNTSKNNIQRGRELVLDAGRLVGLVESGFPQSRSLADKLRRIAIKSDDVHNCVLAYAHAQGELTKTERCGLQILLTHEEYAQFTNSSN
jgi:hypothetical protein